MKNLLLALEVEIHSAIGHSGLAGNISDFGVEVTIVGKNADRRAQNCLAFVGDDGTVRIE
jgi:hypothetical protein